MAIGRVDPHAGLKSILTEAGRQIGGMASIDREKSAAENFTANAAGKAWFVKAEMVRPLGGRRVGGRVARRERRLEVTVRSGGRAKAEELMALLQVDGTIHEQHSIPHGRRHGR